MGGTVWRAVGRGAVTAVAVATAVALSLLAAYGALVLYRFTELFVNGRLAAADAGLARAAVLWFAAPFAGSLRAWSWVRRRRREARLRAWSA